MNLTRFLALLLTVTCCSSATARYICWIERVQVAGDALTVTFIKNKEIGVMKFSDIDPPVLISIFTVGEGMALSSKAVATPLVVEFGVTVELRGGSHSRCTLRAGKQGGFQGIYASAQETGGPTGTVQVNKFIEATP